MDAAENEKLIKQYFKHFNDHDWTKMADMYVKIADFKDPTLGTGIIKQTPLHIYRDSTRSFKI